MKTAAKAPHGELEACLPRVNRYARRLCGARCDDADDLTQIAVSEWLAKPIEGLPVFVQLRRIVRSRFFDLIRSKEHGNLRIDERDGLLDETGDREFEVSVREVLARLPFEDRYLLWSVYGQGYSVDDVAVDMRVNPRTVKRKLARARMRFAAVYGDQSQ